jgi:hypothetical protein
MRGWFVPPIVIPVLIAVSLAGVRLASCIPLKISELRDGWWF